MGCSDPTGSSPSFVNKSSWCGLLCRSSSESWSDERISSSASSFAVCNLFGYNCTLDIQSWMLINFYKRKTIRFWISLDYLHDLSDHCLCFDYSLLYSEEYTRTTLVISRKISTIQIRIFLSRNLCRAVWFAAGNLFPTWVCPKVHTISMQFCWNMRFYVSMYMYYMYHIHWTTFKVGGKTSSDFFPLFSLLFAYYDLKLLTDTVLAGENIMSSSVRPLQLKISFQLPHHFPTYVACFRVAFLVEHCDLGCVSMKWGCVETDAAGVPSWLRSCNNASPWHSFRIRTR